MLIFSYWVKNTNKHAWLDTTPTDINDIGTSYLRGWHHFILVLKSNNLEFTVFHDGHQKGTQTLDRNKSRDPGSGHVIIGGMNQVRHPGSFEQGICHYRLTLFKRYHGFG